MTKKQAYRRTLRKWDRIVFGLCFHIDGTQCALCALCAGCHRCEVIDFTGEPCWQYGPYLKWRKARWPKRLFLAIGLRRPLKRLGKREGWDK